MKNLNITNPEPPVYWQSMARMAAMEKAISEKEELENKVLDDLEDDELIGTAADAFGELFTWFPDEMEMVANRLIQELVLGGLNSNLSGIFSYLPVDAREKIKNYLIENAEI